MTSAKFIIPLEGIKPKPLWVNHFEALLEPLKRPLIQYDLGFCFLGKYKKSPILFST